MTARIMLIVCSVYLLILECLRMKRESMKIYWSNMMNWIAVIPNLSILTVVVYLFMPGAC
jgi:hypothetical protein